MRIMDWSSDVCSSDLCLAFDGRDLLTMPARARRRIIGKDMAMIFQEPMTSLNPCFTVGFQITESLKTHLGGSRKEHRRRAIELLEQVGIPAPDTRLSAFPHPLSGGLNQRVLDRTTAVSGKSGSVRVKLGGRRF